MKKYAIEIEFTLGSETIEVQIYKVDDEDYREEIEDLSFANISDCLHFLEGYSFCLIQNCNEVE